ncbi:MAG TPA: Fe-S protein assembly co-chaperone HscB [Acidobacteriaceae bacterium]|nr:Fe-S protein assembly co-chaperone HscB [Acidobacteriaceae bacterium]
MTVVAEPSKKMLCWSCGSQNDPDAQFCANCGKLQPSTPADYFAFFGLPRRFQLDTAALEKEFYRLSRKFHPDLYARASAEEQRWSLEKSSVLNDAWRTLRDPLARTEYLLGLSGIRLEEQSRDASDRAAESGTAKQQVVPPDLLEEVFELNMQLEEMRMATATGADDPETRRSLESAKQNFDLQLKTSEQDLQRFWSEWDTAAETNDREAQQTAQQNMVDLLNRRSYIRNLLRDVEEALKN